MMDIEVALEALGVLCNAKVNSVQRQGGGLQAADISGAFAHSAHPLLTIFNLVQKVLDGDAFRPVPKGAFAGIPSLQAAHKLSIDTDKDSRGKLKLVVNKDEFFDPGYDYDFTDITDHQKFYRGGEEYERPCGWTRFAVKVLGKYDKDTWLGNRWRKTRSVAGEWPVSYHGTTLSGAEGIIPGNYKAGVRAKYGRGIYSTPDISVAEGYATEFWSKKMGKRCKVLLQNRINPEYREICKENDKYWLVGIPEGTSEEEEKEMVDRAIRPYGLLVKEI